MPCSRSNDGIVGLRRRGSCPLKRTGQRPRKRQIGNCSPRERADSWCLPNGYEAHLASTWFLQAHPGPCNRPLQSSVQTTPGSPLAQAPWDLSELWVRAKVLSHNPVHGFEVRFLSLCLLKGLFLFFFNFFPKHVVGHLTDEATGWDSPRWQV